MNEVILTINAGSSSVKFALYEASVQAPREQAELLGQFFSELRGRQALSLREDFCGTFAISRRWVEQSPKHTALAIDLGDFEAIDLDLDERWPAQSTAPLVAPAINA